MMACPLCVPSISTTYRWHNAIGLDRHFAVSRSRSGLKYVVRFLSHVALEGKTLANSVRVLVATVATNREFRPRFQAVTEGSRTSVRNLWRWMQSLTTRGVRGRWKS